jgi:hypothetical protein
MELRNMGIITKGEYEGRTLEEATVYAQAGGFTTRIVEQDGNSFMVTMDFKTNRLNFRVSNNIITECYGG